MPSDLGRGWREACLVLEKVMTWCAMLQSVSLVFASLISVQHLLIIYLHIEIVFLALVCLCKFNVPASPDNMVVVVYLY